MAIEQLRRFYEAAPFRPFVIHLADGRSVPVENREFIMAARSGRTVSVYQADDALSVIDLLLVAELELKPARNGP
ncbi:MAG: hypothetical protein WD278_15840 [Pirellulales bacterium]